MSTIIFYDFDGAEITRLGNVVIERDWVLNGIGEATFNIPNLNPKTLEDVIQFGTFVIVEQDRLPDWGGVVDVDRDWDGAVIGVSLYSAEKMLTWRKTPHDELLKGTAGALISKLIGYANIDEDTRIYGGSIYGGGVSREETLGKQCWDHIDQIRRRSGCDVFITPELDNTGCIRFALDWHQKLGVKSTFELREGVNLERDGRRVLAERGPIINEITGLGDVGTNKTRIKITKRNQVSIDLYRLRSKNRVYDGNKDMGTLTENVLADLEITAFPYRLFYLTALDVGDTFVELEMGNTYPLFMNTVGFMGADFGVETFVRVLGMKYKERENKIELTLMEE